MVVCCIAEMPPGPPGVKRSSNGSTRSNSRVPTPSLKRSRSPSAGGNSVNNYNRINGTPQPKRVRRARPPGVYGRPPDLAKLKSMLLRRKYVLTEQAAREPNQRRRREIQASIGALTAELHRLTKEQMRQGLVGAPNYVLLGDISNVLKRRSNRVNAEEQFQRKQAENQQFRQWYGRQLDRQRQEVNEQVESVPNPRTPKFQAWIKDLFSARKGAVGPTLLRALQTKPLTTTAYAALASGGERGQDPCGGLAPGVSSLRAHQAVVYAMARLRALGKIDTAGLLVTHSTGAGKTLAGLAVLLAFWNERDEAGRLMPVLFLSTNDNRNENDTHKFATLAMVMFPDFVDETVTPPVKPFAKPAGAPADYWQNEDVVKAVARRIGKRLRDGIGALMARSGKSRSATQAGREIYTFVELGNDLHNGVVVFRRGERCVFVVDEVQYLVSPPATEIAWADRYKLVHHALTKGRDPRSTWCVGMTATPGETPEDVRSILNAILGHGRHIQQTDSIEAMREKARGHVSYAYLLGDRQRFAAVRLRVLCSYLVDGKGRPSYYYEPYFRHLHRAFSEHGGMPNDAKQFLANLKNANPGWTRRPRAAKSYTDEHYWSYDAAKSDAFLQPLRRLSLFLEPDNIEMKHLLDSPGRNGDDDNNAADGRRKWHEIVVARSTSGKATVTVKSGDDKDIQEENDDFGNEFDEGVNVQAFDQRASARALPPNLRVSSREKTVRHYRYLLSPKITQFLRFVYNDLPLNTNRVDTKRHGIHYVFTSSPTAALLVAHALERVLGLPQLKAAGKWNPSMGAHFVMIDDVKSSLALLARFRTPKGNIDALKKLVSSDDNRYGEKIKVVIATKKSFKGVDLRHVRYLHLLDPMVNFRDFIQFVGRGPRNCSHAGHKDPFVEVVLYRLLHSPADRCPSQAGAALVDCFLWNHAYARYFGQGRFSDIEDNVLWRASVDYELFKDNLAAGRDALRRMVARLDDKCDHMVYDKEPNQQVALAGTEGLLEGFSQLERDARARLNKHVQALHKKRQPANYPSAQIRAANKEVHEALKKEVRKLQHKLTKLPATNDSNNRLAALAGLQQRIAALRQAQTDEKKVYADYKKLRFALNEANDNDDANADQKRLWELKRANVEQLNARHPSFNAWYKHNKAGKHLKDVMKSYDVDVVTDSVRAVNLQNLNSKPAKRPAPSPAPVNANSKRAKADEARDMRQKMINKYTQKKKAIGTMPVVPGLAAYKAMLARGAKAKPNAQGNAPPPLSANNLRALEQQARAQFTEAAVWTNFLKEKERASRRQAAAAKKGQPFDMNAVLADLYARYPAAEVRHRHSVASKKIKAEEARNQAELNEFKRLHGVVNYGQ